MKRFENDFWSFGHSQVIYIWDVLETIDYINHWATENDENIWVIAKNSKPEQSDYILCQYNNNSNMIRFGL